MKALVVLIVLLLVGIVGVGFYRGWFQLSTNSTENKSNATITVSDPAATNSPQTVNVTLQIEDSDLRILVFGSSVANGWNGGGSLTNGSYAGGYAGDPDVVGFEDLCNVMGGGVAFNIRIGRDNDLGDALADDPVAKLIYPDIIGTDTFEGVYNAVQDMIAQLPGV